MSLTLRVLAPDQSVFDGSADEVILPSTTGQVGILPGHVSLLAALDVGVLRVRTNSDWQSIALMGGFAEVESDDVTVLVNAAELGVNIDSRARPLAACCRAESEAARASNSGVAGAFWAVPEAVISADTVAAHNMFDCSFIGFL